MPGNKYIANVSGRLTEVASTQTGGTVGDAGKVVALDGTGRLDSSMMPVGIGADTNTATATEALSAGNFVNIWNNGGVVSVRKADAATNKEAHGFVLASVALGAAATIFSEGSNTGLTGLTPGSRYYLSATTPGAATSTPPSAAGQIVQFVGVAVSTTAVNFEAGDPITLA